MQACLGGLILLKHCTVHRSLSLVHFYCKRFFYCSPATGGFLYCISTTRGFLQGSLAIGGGDIHKYTTGQVLLKGGIPT
jgi:hypothetical protein